VLVGLGVPDDAAVLRINRTTAVVSTLDFFAPVVDDPFEYGAIAAANAMSDVFAMGGEVVLALNIAAFPQDLPPGVQTEILRGGAAKVSEAGGVVAGGHTVWDAEPKYGMSVLGLVHPNRILTKSALRPGDILYLTKPLGTGTLLSAAKQDRAEDAWIGSATESMLRLNRHASHLVRESRLRAATDVSGFGLLGHLWEMLTRSGVAAQVEAEKVPLLPGARNCSSLGIETGGGQRNRSWVGENAAITAAVDSTVSALLFDPQTSGGLLFGCPERRAPALEAAFTHDEEPLWRIGNVYAGDPRIVVR